MAEWKSKKLHDFNSFIMCMFLQNEQNFLI